MILNYVIKDMPQKLNKTKRFMHFMIPARLYQELFYV